MPSLLDELEVISETALLSSEAIAQWQELGAPLAYVALSLSIARMPVLMICVHSFDRRDEHSTNALQSAFNNNDLQQINAVLCELCHAVISDTLSASAVVDLCKAVIASSSSSSSNTDAMQVAEGATTSDSTLAHAIESTLADIFWVMDLEFDPKADERRTRLVALIKAVSAAQLVSSSVRSHPHCCTLGIRSRFLVNQLAVCVQVLKERLEPEMFTAVGLRCHPKNFQRAIIRLNTRIQYAYARVLSHPHSLTHSLTHALVCVDSRNPSSICCARRTKATPNS